ncbi:hypothetical protein FQZ97_604170 [compost metagenome]
MDPTIKIPMMARSSGRLARPLLWGQIMDLPLRFAARMSRHRVTQSSARMKAEMAGQTRKYNVNHISVSLFAWMGQPLAGWAMGRGAAAWACASCSRWNEVTRSARRAKSNRRVLRRLRPVHTAALTP